MNASGKPTKTGRREVGRLRLVSQVALTNVTDSLQVIWLEPWGEDYTLYPGESIELIAEAFPDPPAFEFHECPNGLQVFVEGLIGGDYDFRVLQNGVTLQCGHQRQIGIAAGHHY
jgi:hypothetical protein